MHKKIVQKINKQVLEILNKSSDAVVVVDNNLGKIVFANEGFCKMVGLSKRKIEEGKVSDFCTKEGVGMIKKIINNKNTLASIPVKKKGGKTIFCSVGVSRFSSCGEHLVISFLRDETKNHEMKERYEILTEKNPDCIKIFDLKGKLLYINKGGLKEHGLKNINEALSGWDIEKSIEKKDRATFRKALSDAKKGKSSVVEFHHIPEFSTRKVCSELITPIKDDSGNIVNILGISRDISGIKKTEKSLEENEHRLNAIVENIGDGIFVTDPKHKILILNKQAQLLSGFDFKDVEDTFLKDNMVFVKEGSDNSIYNIMKKKLDSSGFFDFSEVAGGVELIKKDKSRIPIRGNVTLLKDNEGKDSGCVGVFRDMTKDRENDKIKNEFISIASHQLRTPLSGIKWFSELLLDDKESKLTTQQREFLEKIRLSNERLISLVRDLLDVSHIESGDSFQIRRRFFSLDVLINKVLSEIDFLIKKNNVKISINDCLEKGIEVYADRGKIKQVLYNLITNAVKFSNFGGVVEIGCENKVDELVFYVKDHGIGIPTNQQGRVFDKFFKAENNTDLPLGTGLGLYIAKSIIEMHKGKIWFVSREGRGSGFYFSLPVHKKDE